VKRLTLVALCCTLSACGGGEHEDLREWITENTREIRSGIPKLPEVQAYQPVPYDVESLLDPFRTNKIEPEAKARQGQGRGSIYQPDFEAREKRASILEKYPLESIKLIGFVNLNKIPMAIVKVEDKTKQVKLGDYIGLDFGMVTKITEQEIVLKELIQDSAGDWSERQSTLLLQEREGSQK
jgi:type IV pilus assembly protein PilP